MTPEAMTIGNGKQMVATKVGKLDVLGVLPDGSKIKFTMQEVRYVPELWVKLFSLTAAMKNGYAIGSEEDKCIFVWKQNFKLPFHRKIPTKNGFLLGIDLLARTQEQANLTLNEGTKIKM
jgi:hypothetical protein